MQHATTCNRQTTFIVVVSVIIMSNKAKFKYKYLGFQCLLHGRINGTIKKASCSYVLPTILIYCFHAFSMLQQGLNIELVACL